MPWRPVARSHARLYDLLRVRGYTGGFYHDALAAIDIALWDIVGKSKGKSIANLLGSDVLAKLPAYISGLPESELEDRCALAHSWLERGFTKFKFALPVANQGVGKEMQGLRETLGASANIACDMHWRRDRAEALDLAQQMAPYNPWFLEAPLTTEDIEGLKWLNQQTESPIAVGEEWRTIHDARLRIDAAACAIVQPEMGHTGITQFLRIVKYAQTKGLRVMPHATIGAGIFLAASLQVSAVRSVECHEFQHSLLSAFAHFTTGDLKCESGSYQVPNGIGIGAEPTAEMKSHMKLL